MTSFADPTETTTEPEIVVPGIDDTTDDPAEAPETVAGDSPRPRHGEAAGELLWLDQHQLIRGRNRPVKPADPDFDASIAKYGNFVPLVVRRTEDGGFEVHDGWHRVEALRKTTHMALCAVYPAGTSGEEIEREIERILLQYSTGAHRYGQSATDRVDAVEQLLDLGVSPTKTSKLLVGVGRAEAMAVAKLKKSEAARQALNDSDLDLMQAAKVADEFGEDPDAVDALIAAAQTGQFEHVLQQMLDDRAAAEAEERTAAAYTEAAEVFRLRGMTVLDPETVPSALPAAFADLIDGDGNPASPEQVAPEHVAVLLVQQAMVTEGGGRIGVDQIDPNSYRFPDEEADPDMYHQEDVDLLDEWAPRYYCPDPVAAGLSPIRVEQPDVSEPEPPAEDPAELAARREREARARRAREEAEAAQKRADSAARQKVGLLNNRARAATTVRRDWVVANLFSGQKTVPAGSWELIGAVLNKPELLNGYHAPTMARELGTKVPAEPATTGVKARDNHGALRALLRVVAASEADLQPDTTHADYYRRVSPLKAAYIRFLVSAGYQASPIEQVLTGDMTTDQVLGENLPATPPTQSNNADQEESGQEHTGPEVGEDTEADTGTDDTAAAA